jgi:hypothetical protein
VGRAQQHEHLSLAERARLVLARRGRGRALDDLARVALDELLVHGAV